MCFFFIPVLYQQCLLLWLLLIHLQHVWISILTALIFSRRLHFNICHGYSAIMHTRISSYHLRNAFRTSFLTSVDLMLTIQYYTLFSGILLWPSTININVTTYGLLMACLFFFIYLAVFHFGPLLLP